MTVTVARTNADERHFRTERFDYPLVEGDARTVMTYFEHIDSSQPLFVEHRIDLLAFRIPCEQCPPVHFPVLVAIELGKQAEAVTIAPFVLVGVRPEHTKMEVPDVQLVSRVHWAQAILSDDVASFACKLRAFFALTCQHGLWANEG